MTLRPSLSRLAALLAAALLVPTAGSAQATVASSINVLLPAVSGSGVRPVAFGTVTPGGTRSLPASGAFAVPADSSATGVGAIAFTGVVGKRDAQLTFALPTSLTNTATLQNMPVTLNGSFGLVCWDLKAGKGNPVCTVFNPSPGGSVASIFTTTPPNQSSGDLRIYLGGRVSPGTTLGAGVYQGQITVTLARL